MKTKKGLLKNVMGLVLAILGILAFISAGYRLYQVFADQDIQNAKHALDVIEAKASALEEGKTNIFTLLGPEQWMLFGWSKEDRDAPDRCYFSSCICACPSLTSVKDTTLLNFLKDKTISQQAAVLCQDKGICRSISFSSVKLQSHQLDYIDPATKEPAISSIIPFRKNFIELRMTKKQNLLTIDSDRLPDAS